MDEEMPQQQAEPQGDGPQWHIVEMVPLPTTGQPTHPPRSKGDAQESPPPEPPAASPPRPTRVPTSRPLWGDLDALLASGPVGAPLAAEALLAEGEKRRVARRRRQLVRRLRRMAFAALVGVVVGAGIWWGLAWLHHPLHLRVGSTVPYSAEGKVEHERTNAQLSSARAMLTRPGAQRIYRESR
jgi:hypothetical protein